MATSTTALKPQAPRQYEVAKLAVIFLTWKAFLLFLAYLSPGPGYDTSTVLLGPTQGSLPNKLVRWDAIYFSVVAHRGYLFEQEWAFGWGYSQLVRLITSFLDANEGVFPVREAWMGIAISHISHFISVIALYDMSKQLFKHRLDSTALPYLASVLHILSPAGMFLSAPYSEGLFSCLSFLGYCCLTRAMLNQGASIKTDILYLMSASFMSLAATVRSNGLLNGLLFAHEALYGLMSIVSGGISFEKLRHLVLIGICGCLIGIGNTIPQYLAYKEFCSIEMISQRPWCESVFPSIYNFVQAHYWNAGFLKYWTLPNLPLFVFAIPCISLFAMSSIWAWSTESSGVKPQKLQTPHARSVGQVLRILALPQLALVVLIMSRYHVQIVTRLSSGYPVWYWWISKSISRNRETRNGKAAKAAITWMVGYGILQGALFASFLPPA